MQNPIRISARSSTLPSRLFGRFAAFVAGMMLIVSQFASPAALYACPFCENVGAPFVEEFEINDMVVFAKLVKRPDMNDENVINAKTTELPKAIFEIYYTVKGGSKPP